MNKTEKIKIALIVLLHLIGFPLLLFAVISNAKLIVKNGKGYGIFAYAGIILVLAFALVYYIVFGIMVLRKKKSPIRQSITLSIIAMLLFSGLFIFISVAAPDKLLSVTSGTISYEDLTGQYNERAATNKKLLDDFVYLNTFANGNLVYADSKKPEDGSNLTVIYELKNKKPYENIESFKQNGYKLELATNLPEIKSLDEEKYKKEKNKWIVAQKDAYDYYTEKGFKEKKLVELVKGIYSSLNDDGYANFSGPWMDFAAANVITIPVLVHLLLDANKHAPSKPFPSLSADGLRTAPVKWSVLDMMGPPLGISTYQYKDTVNALYEVQKENIEQNAKLSKEEKDKQIAKLTATRYDDLSKAEYNNIFEVPSMSINLDLVKNPAISDLFANSSVFVNGLFGLITNIAGSEGVVGAPIYVDIDPNNGKVNLSGSSIRRGAMGYQNSAWFDSNNLIYMLISVFSTRVLCLIFSGYLILMSLLTGLLRQNKTRVEIEKDEHLDKIILKELVEGHDKETTLKDDKKSKVVKPLI